MTDCVSKRSKLCAGYGNELWLGMCSNCADVRDLDKKRKTQSDWQFEREEEHRRLVEYAREHNIFIERTYYEGISE